MKPTILLSTQNDCVIRGGGKGGQVTSLKVTAAESPKDAACKISTGLPAELCAYPVPTTAKALRRRLALAANDRQPPSRVQLSKARHCRRWRPVEGELSRADFTALRSGRHLHSSLHLPLLGSRPCRASVRCPTGSCAVPFPRNRRDRFGCAGAPLRHKARSDEENQFRTSHYPRQSCR